jgi:type I restriction enzyme M protein
VMDNQSQLKWTALWGEWLRGRIALYLLSTARTSSNRYATRSKNAWRRLLTRQHLYGHVGGLIVLSGNKDNPAFHRYYDAEQRIRCDWITTKRTTLVGRKSMEKPKEGDVTVQEPDEAEDQLLDEEGGEPIPQDTLICALTGEFRPDKPEERVLQGLVEQLHREYRVELSDMARDVKVPCIDASGKKKTVAVAIAVYEHGKPHELNNIIRVVLIAKANAKVSDSAIAQLDLVLSNLSDDRDEVYGVWTNGKDMAFRMRTYDPANGFPISTELTDFPGPDETLADLDDADRRPLRVAAGDSLLRTFNHCHDYLSTQGLRDEKAFWQLLYLIFAKILDEQQSRRRFFVGATERNTPEGQERIAKRIHSLFELVKSEFEHVFDGFERLEMNDRALAYVAAQLARFDLLSTDTDAKGMAFEAITSHTLKQKKGQFFTPRNVIQMMVEMVDPQPGKRVLDPACGSGGFLIVALNHARRRILAEVGCPYPDAPVQLEIKKAESKVRSYAREPVRLRRGQRPSQGRPHEHGHERRRARAHFQFQQSGIRGLRHEGDHRQDALSHARDGGA